MRWPRFLRRRRTAPWDGVPLFTFHHERMPDGSVRPVLDDVSILDPRIDQRDRRKVRKDNFGYPSVHD